MVLSASQSDSLVIKQSHLEHANMMASAIEDDMPKVFSNIGQTEITRGSQELVNLVESNPGVSQVQLYKALFRNLSYKDFTEALNGAINSAQVRALHSGNEIKYYPVKKAEGSA